MALRSDAPLSDQAILVAIIRHGGFTAAAQALELSKSALSKRLSKLENRLGVKLVHRTTRNVTLTEAGQHYHAHALSALEAVADAENAARRYLEQPTGPVRIIAPMAFGRRYLAPLLPGFLARHPRVTIDLVLDDRLGEADRTDHDFALRTAMPSNGATIVRNLAPLRSVVCAAPDYFGDRPLPDRPALLSRENGLTFSQSPRVDHWTFRGPDGSQADIPVSGNLRANNSEALCDAVMAGLGIARLPTFIAGPRIRAGELSLLLPDHAMPARTLQAAYSPSLRGTPVVQALTALCVEAFAGPVPPWDEGLPPAVLR